MDIVRSWLQPADLHVSTSVEVDTAPERLRDFVTDLHHLEELQPALSDSLVTTGPDGRSGTYRAEQRLLGLQFQGDFQWSKDGHGVVYEGAWTHAGIPATRERGCLAVQATPTGARLIHDETFQLPRLALPLFPLARYVIGRLLTGENRHIKALHENQGRDTE